MRLLLAQGARPTRKASPKAPATSMSALPGWTITASTLPLFIRPYFSVGRDEVEDPGLATAYCRVYNTWLTDLCRPYSDRMVPIAHVALHNIEDAVIEVKRAAKLGARGVYIFATPVYDIPYGDRRYDPFWKACQELNLPIGIHVSNTPKHAGRHLYQGGFHSNYWWFNVMYNQDCQMAFTSFFQGGVFERFPELSVGVVETGCGWIAHWLELLDSKYKITGHPEMSMLPSEYFDRQGWITGEADEKDLPAHGPVGRGSQADVRLRLSPRGRPRGTGRRVEGDH